MVKAILLGLLISTTVQASTPDCLELMQKTIIDNKAEGYDFIGEQKSQDGYGTCGGFANPSGDLRIECVIDVRGLDTFFKAMSEGQVAISKKAECSHAENNYHVFAISPPKA